jgi:glycosyltransferase involved in cell wall biosynthesis
MWSQLSHCPVIHVQNIDSPLLIGAFAKVLLRKKVVVTIHGEKSIVLKKLAPLGKWRVGLMTRVGDIFVALTEPCRQQYLEEGIASDRIISIPNGVDIERFHPPTAKQRADSRRLFRYRVNDTVVLYIGRLVDLKRVDSLMEAWKTIVDIDSARCVVVGDGPARENLESQVCAEGLDKRIRFVGTANDVLPYYQAADIFVLPSLYEGLSVALLEAMACGLCVVVAGSPGNLAVVEHGVNGLVFPADQPRLLQESLARVLSDGELCRSLGQAARQTVVQTYSIQTTARAHIGLYSRLLGT